MRILLRHLRPFRFLLLGGAMLVAVISLAWWSGETVAPWVATPVGAQATCPPTPPNCSGGYCEDTCKAGQLRCVNGGFVADPTCALSETPVVTSVNVATTSNSAAINFTTNLPAQARVKYGVTTAYGSFEPSGGAFVQSQSGTFQINLSGLNPSTTYHFAIETMNMLDTGRQQTGDRTFFTAGGGGSGGGPLTINGISVECIGANCRVSYSTSVEANVQIKYDTSDKGSFDNYTLGAVGEPAGFYSAATRSLNINGLSLGVTYHFRIRATDRSNGTTTSGNQQFTTGVNSEDRTFSTGACSQGGQSYPIGSCLPDGGKCEPGGIIVYRCDNQCNYLCQPGQTCSSGGQCLGDPALTGSPYQCNQPGCYTASGSFANPAAEPGCYASWPRCTANTVLKVRKDRACNLWLTCNTTLQTAPQTGRPAENLCLSLSACNGLNTNGQCNNLLPSGQCDNDPLRFCSSNADCLAGGTCNVFSSQDPALSLRDVEYNTPAGVSNIANLSGNVIAGLDWGRGSERLSGALPWQLMRQLGGSTSLKNGDLENNPPSYAPWIAAPFSPPPGQPESVLTNIFEDQNRLPNHVLKVEPPRDPNNSSNYIQFSGAALGEFFSSGTENYFGEVRVRSASGPLRLLVRFAYNNYQDFQTVAVTATSAWQRFRVGPVTGMSGRTWFEVVCAQVNECGVFWLDDVVVKPVLQINTDPAFVGPTCRLYPREDSPSCDYTDLSGVTYQGWRGYCLEHDSVTGTCLSWWPVDLIQGQGDISGSERQAGYKDRIPLFICTEAAGLSNLGPDKLAPYVYESTYGTFSQGCGFTNPGSCQYSKTIVDPPPDDGRPEQQTATKSDALIHEYDIVKAVWHPSSNPFSYGNPTIVVVNNEALQNSTLASPAVTGVTYGQNRYDILRTTEVLPGNISGQNDPPWNSDQDIVWYVRSACTDGQKDNPDSRNCIAEAALVFDKGTKLLKYYHLFAWDATPCSSGGCAEPIGYLVTLYTRESCLQLTQVVTPTGETQAFANRVGSSAYRVPTLNYSRTTDLTPYGGVVPPDLGNNPANWPLLEISQPDYVNFSSDSGQARGGTPYACNGACDAMTCTATGQSCLTGGKIDSRKVRDCQEHTDALGQPDPGQCTGVETNVASAKGPQTISSANPATDTLPDTGTNPFFAQTRLQRLFTQSHGVWRWNGDKYEPKSGGWDPPRVFCPVSTADPTKYERPGFNGDYCGIPPEVSCPDQTICDQYTNSAGTPIPGYAQFLNAAKNHALISGGSGSVAIKFLTDADIEQVPLQFINIDWGDGVSQVAFPYAPRNDPSNPHIIGHNYVIEPNNPNCSLPFGALRRSCEYPIRIQVKDAWGWCNNASATVPCPPAQNTWIDTGLRVNVEP